MYADVGPTSECDFLLLSALVTVCVRSHVFTGMRECVCVRGSDYVFMVSRWRARMRACVRMCGAVA